MIEPRRSQYQEGQGWTSIFNAIGRANNGLQKMRSPCLKNDSLYPRLDMNF